MQKKFEEEVKLKIQRRLVSNDDQIKLRKNLKRKIKPVVEDCA